MATIGGLKFDSPLILAPMAGLFDLPLRLTYREFGFGLTSIGSISAGSFVRSGKNRLLNLCGQEEFTDERETPLMVQLIGSDPSMMATAAAQIQEKADVIDLNFGCPLKEFTRQGWGAALCRDLKKLESVVKAVVQAVRVPVTVKTRIVSLEKTSLTQDLARRCRDAGAAAFILHARTPQEGFCSPPHWDIFRDIKKILSIPLVGNGGTRDLSDAKNLLENYGCDYVMVGASALRSPVAFNAVTSKVGASRTDFSRRYSFHKKRPFFGLLRSQLHLKFLNLKMERFASYARAR